MWFPVVTGRRARLAGGSAPGRRTMERCAARLAGATDQPSTMGCGGRVAAGLPPSTNIAAHRAGRQPSVEPEEWKMLIFASHEVTNHLITERMF